MSPGRRDKSSRATQTAADTYYESIISRLALLKLSAALKVIWAGFRRIKALRKLDGVNIFRALLKWRGVKKKKKEGGGALQTESHLRVVNPAIISQPL